MIFDCHVHTTVSGDSSVTMEDVNEFLQDKDLGIIVTEHVEFSV